MLRFKQFILEYFTLLENRIDFLKNQFAGKLDTSHDPYGVHKDHENIIDHFANNADPTKNKAHTQWILKQYQQKKIRQEDHPRIKETLSNFERYKSKLPNRDINNYKSLSEIEDAIEPHLGTTVSGKEEKKQIKDIGSREVYKSKNLLVKHLQTPEAACHYGKGTKWCTASEHGGMFGHYSNSGPLYYVEGKDNNGEKKKFQFHFPSKQFMDERDNPINLGEFIKNNPEIKDVKEFQETKHPAFDKNLTPDDIHKEIDRFEVSTPEDRDYYGEHYRTNLHDMIHNPNFNTDHVKRILDKHQGVYDPDYMLKELKDHPAITSDVIDSVLKNPNHKLDAKRLVLSHRNATPEQLMRHINDHSLSLTALQHPNLPKEEIDKAIHGDNDYRTQAVAYNPTLNSDQLHHLLTKAKTANDETQETIHHSIMDHPNADSSHIKRIFDNLKDKHEPTYQDGMIISGALKHDKLKGKDLDDVVNNHPEYHTDLQHNKNLTSENIHRILDDNMDYLPNIKDIINHKNFNEDHLHRIIKSDNGLSDINNSLSEIIPKIVAHKKINTKHLNDLVNHHNDTVREYTAIEHPDLTPKHIDTLLNDKNPKVRRYAAGHKNATEDNITKALSDENQYVREATKDHLNKFTPEHYEKYLEHPDTGTYTTSSGKRTDDTRKNVVKNFALSYPHRAVYNNEAMKLAMSGMTPEELEHHAHNHPTEEGQKEAINRLWLKKQDDIVNKIANTHKNETLRNHAKELNSDEGEGGWLKNMFREP